jgi:hypothetical protein
MFIELHRDGRRMLVNTMWINKVIEDEGWISIGEYAAFCDETYDEIRGMIKKVELVVDKKCITQVM